MSDLSSLPIWLLFFFQSVASHKVKFLILGLFINSSTHTFLTSSVIPSGIVASTSSLVSVGVLTSVGSTTTSSVGTVTTSSTTGGVTGVLVSSLVFALVLAFSLLASLLAASSSFSSSSFVRLVSAFSSSRIVSVTCSGDLSDADFCLLSTIPSVRASVATCSSRPLYFLNNWSSGESTLGARSSPSATLCGTSDSTPSVRNPFLNLRSLPLLLPLYVSPAPDRRCRNICSAFQLCFPFLFSA